MQLSKLKNSPPRAEISILNKYCPCCKKNYSFITFLYLWLKKFGKEFECSKCNKKFYPKYSQLSILGFVFGYVGVRVSVFITNHYVCNFIFNCPSALFYIVITLHILLFVILFFYIVYLLFPWNDYRC